MKFHFNGTVQISSPFAKAYSSLIDPNFMATTIPDIQSFKVIDQDHFDAKIKVGISLVRGTVEMKFAILDKNENAHARLVGDGSGAGSKIHVDSVFNLARDGDGATTMNWAADADLSGLIAGIRSQVLRGQSEKQVSEIFKNVKKKLESI